MQLGFFSVSVKFRLGRSLGPVHGWDLLLLTRGGSGWIGSGGVGSAEPVTQNTGHEIDCRELSSHGGPWEMGKQEQSSLC